MAKKFSSGSFKASSSQQTVVSDKKDDEQVSKSNFVKNNSVETSDNSDNFDDSVDTNGFEQRKADKIDKLNNQILPLVGLGIMIILIIVGVIMVYKSISGKSAVDARIAEVQQQSDELEGLLNDATKEYERQVREAQAELDAKQNTASTEGINVALAQTNICEAAVDPDKFSDKEVKDFQTVLYRYFGNKVFIKPWYVGDNSTWQFCSTYQYPSKKIPVLWVCAKSKSEYNAIYAYMRGVYDVEKNLFTNCVYHMTKYGDELKTEDNNSSFTDDELESVGIEVGDNYSDNKEPVKTKKKKSKTKSKAKSKKKKKTKTKTNKGLASRMICPV